MALVNRYGLKRTHLQAPHFLLCREKDGKGTAPPPLNCTTGAGVGHIVRPKATGYQAYGAFETETADGRSESQIIDQPYDKRMGEIP